MTIYCFYVCPTCTTEYIDLIVPVVPIRERQLTPKLHDPITEPPYLHSVMADTVQASKPEEEEHEEESGDDDESDEDDDNFGEESEVSEQDQFYLLPVSL